MISPAFRAAASICCKRFMVLVSFLGRVFVCPRRTPYYSFYQLIYANKIFTDFNLNAHHNPRARPGRRSPGYRTACGSPTSFAFSPTFSPTKTEFSPTFPFFSPTEAVFSPTFPFFSPTEAIFSPTFCFFYGMVLGKMVLKENRFSRTFPEELHIIHFINQFTQIKYLRILI